MQSNGIVLNGHGALVAIMAHGTGRTNYAPRPSRTLTVLA